MLSIIISSYQPHYYIALEKNICETIGIPYEIIKINNPNIMGICEAYNKGAAKAQYDFLLFIHEDIVFHTQNWGELLIKHLKKENTGVLGIAGSNYVPAAPSGWYLYHNDYNFSNIIQNNKQKSFARLYSNTKYAANVIAMDGVFLVVKKSVYNEFLFDESIKGFHGYDLDFTLRVATKYKNYVIGNVLIEHFSEGNEDEKWLKNNIQIRKKIKHQFNQVFDEKFERIAFQIFLKKFFMNKQYSFKNIISTLYFLPSQLKFSSYISIIKSYLYYLKKYKLS